MASNQELKKVVLVGAAGNLGSIIFNALLEAKNFDITVLTRDSSLSKLPNNVNVIETTYTEEELVKAFQGQDVIISAIGAMGFQSQNTMIDAAIKAGVKRFLPSEFSANTMSDAVVWLVPVFQPKMEVLNYLKQKESTGLTWTGLAPGVLLDEGLKNGFLGFDLAHHRAEVWDGGNTSFSATNAADFGRAIVSILRHPSQTANQYLYVSSITTTQTAILKSLQAHSGKTWQVEDVQTGQQVAKGRRMVSDGNFMGMFELVRASFWGTTEGIRSNYAVHETLSNSILGLSAERDDVVDTTVARLLSTQ